MRKRAAATLLVALIIFCTRPPQSPGQEKTEYKLNVKVNLVRVDALVLHKGQPVLGLKKEDFRVYEDGVLQEIKYIDIAPLSVVIVVDQSGSLEKSFEEVKRRAKSIFELLPPESEIAIVGFDFKINFSTDFTTNRGETALLLSELKNTGGGTNITAALNHSIEKLVIHSISRLRRRAIILISDNLHGWTISKENKPITVDKVPSRDKLYMVDALIRNEIVVYNIKVGKIIPKEMAAPTASGEDLVRKLVEISGGQMIETSDKKSLARALKTAVERLTNTYSLYYTPSDQNKTSLRKVKVELKENPVKKINLGFAKIPTPMREYEVVGHKEYYLVK